RRRIRREGEWTGVRGSESRESSRRRSRRSRDGLRGSVASAELVRRHQARVEDWRRRRDRDSEVAASRSRARRQVGCRGHGGAPRRQGRGGAEAVARAIVSDKPVSEWLVPAGNPGDYKASGVAKSWAQPAAAGSDISLTPFYRTHEKTYSVYFDVLTPAEFDG